MASRQAVRPEVSLPSSARSGALHWRRCCSTKVRELSCCASATRGHGELHAALRARAAPSRRVGRGRAPAPVQAPQHAKRRYHPGKTRAWQVFGRMLQDVPGRSSHVVTAVKSKHRRGQAGQTVAQAGQPRCKHPHRRAFQAGAQGAGWTRCPAKTSDTGCAGVSTYET